MQHEKIFKREGGEVIVSVFVDSTGIEIQKVVSSHKHNDGTYRLSYDSRAATQEEILETKIEFWIKLKPE